MAWTSLTFSFGSLLTSTKMTQLYDNITAAFNKDASAPVLANSYIVNAMIAASAVNGTSIEANAVAQDELKTTTATGSVAIGASSDASLALTGGSWSLWTGSATAGATGASVGFGNGNTAAGTIGLKNTDGGNSLTFYVDERYVQASPPYHLGATKWGHFLYILRSISTGEVRGAWEAPDPTWANNGALWNPDKNSEERILAAPHPFADYWSKPPATDGLEVVMVDLRNTNVDAVKDFCRREEVRLRKGVKPFEELLKAITIGQPIPAATLGMPQSFVSQMGFKIVSGG